MKKIFKFILLWVTALSLIAFACALDGCPLSTFIIWTIINLFLGLITCNWLTYDDLYVLSGSKWFNSKFHIVDKDK